jgi:outer membrane protein TolC
MNVLKKFNKAFGMLCLLILSHQAVAQTTEEANNRVVIVDEDYLTFLVKTNNFDYKKATITYKQIKRQRNNQWNYLFPTITGNAGATYNGPGGLDNNYYLNNNNSSGSDSTKVNEWSGNVSLEATVNLSLWVEMNILKTMADYDAGKINYEIAQRDLTNIALKNFHRLIFDKQILDLRQSTVNLSRTTYNQNLSSYRNGLLQEVDLLRSQVQLENDINSYQSYKTKYDSDILSFKKFLGIPLERELVLRGRLDLLPGRFNIDTMLKYAESTPAVRAVQAELWSEKWNSYRQHLNMVEPYAEVGYGVGNRDYNMTTNNNGEWRDGFYATFGVRVRFDSMLPWSQSGLSLWELRDGVNLKNEESKEEFIKAKMDIMNSVNSLNDVGSRLISLKLASDVSQRSLDLINAGYRRGTREFIEVQRAIDDRNEAIVNYLDGQFEYYGALLDLAQLADIDLSSLLSMGAKY